MILDVNQSHDATCVPSTSSDHDGHTECASTSVPRDSADDSNSTTYCQGPGSAHPSILSSSKCLSPQCSSGPSSTTGSGQACSVQMVKAIQVLRIHLLELEKVNELCKDFCNRYITCLKTKMHSDNLLRNDLGGPYSPNQSSISLHPQDLLQSSPNSISTVSGPPQGIVVPAAALQQGNIAMTTINSAQVVSGGALYQPVAMVTSQGQVTQAVPQGAIQVNLDLTSLLDSEDKKSKNKRGVLPKHATNIMRSWLFQHLMHPYPTEDEKRQIAAQTNLTLLQVNNWFINARRRILQPMLDASNPDPAPKAKKIKSQHRPTQRFWPNSIAAGVLQQQGTLTSANPDGSVNMENLQSLSSDSATLAMQQAMLAVHDDSLDGTEDEDEEEDMEEDDDLEDEEDLQTTNVSDLGLEHTDPLE
ncbi:homeobox protein PKNOX2 isoform X3 [Rhinatrema bivittatum]|uniref:homeobox protein PKNOX2 isoform X3 n=1 Tax=Rhinatrema bivittatum TaxID=194408 RepID=UPI0011279D36|nr:homeobox protein PKNOX2 isoform X3 [Rhinatrema bivittatum]